MKELLPIGSIVKVDILPKHEFMIMGWNFEYEKQSYDYVGVVYPEGFVNETSCFVFQQEHVSEVLYRGYTEKVGE